MIQLRSAVAVAILTVIVAPIIRGELRGRLGKRIALHADLRHKLDGNAVALAHLDELLTSEIAVLKVRETSRLNRNINGGNVAALIVVTVVGPVLSTF